MVLGVDVSHYDGLVPWCSAKQSNIEFCFIKASEGMSIIDPYFEQNWKASELAGLLKGAYHFFRGNADPYAQANNFLKVVESQMGHPSDLPAVLDFEIASQGVPVNTQIDYALQWLAVVEKQTQKKPIIYTGPSFIDQLGNPTFFESYPLWIAHYNVSAPRIPKPWETYSFWQYSDNGQIGQSRPFDMNKFNGDYDELKAFGSN
jgi:lysozyme